MARHKPRKVSESNAAICRIGSAPSKTSELVAIKMVEGTENHISKVLGSNRSFVSPVINFCCKLALMARKALAVDMRSMPGTEAWSSPAVESAQPVATTRIGAKSHLSNGKPMSRTINAVNTQVVDPKISAKATEVKRNAMLSAPMEIEVATAIGKIIKANSEDVGTTIGAAPCRERFDKFSAKHTKPLQRKWRLVTNFGNPKAYLTKTHFTESFIVESAIK
mmetsp:Transcript_41478/g.119599  ORF Transcript_41478/g.119599 Transcript_41478/m.119599 type:complete len:222 (-) Transcript_41478:412-1077(-)